MNLSVILAATEKMKINMFSTVEPRLIPEGAAQAKLESSDIYLYLLRNPKQRDWQAE